MSETEGGHIAEALNRLSDLLTGLLPDPSPANVVLVRMAVLSINAAVEAGIGTDVADTEIIAAAHTAAEALLDAVA